MQLNKWIRCKISYIKLFTIEHNKSKKYIPKLRDTKQYKTILATQRNFNVNQYSPIHTSSPISEVFSAQYTEHIQYTYLAVIIQIHSSSFNKPFHQLDIIALYCNMQHSTQFLFSQNDNTQ